MGINQKEKKRKKNNNSNMTNKTTGTIDDIKFLMSDNIGKIVCQGLAHLYLAKPKFPIDYLGRWILNKSQEIKNQEKSTKLAQNKKELKEQFKKQQDQIENESKAKEQQLQQVEEKNSQFKKKIQEYEYLEELLVEELPEFLEQNKKLTGVYIGQLNYPPKDINDDEEDENAHLQTTQPKVIHYVGFSKSQRTIMEGKILPLEQGVTADVFKEKEAVEEQQQPEDDQQQKAVVQKPNYVYIPDVVKEPKMQFFKIPKLGAYIAVPLICKTCLNEQSFDATLEERLKFLKAKEEQDQLKAQKQQEHDDKLKEMEETGEDTTEFVKQFKAELEGMEEIKEGEIVTAKKEYVICGDTLGQDCEIPEETRKYLEEYSKLFSESWEKMEKSLLVKDIDRQVQYLHSLSANCKDLVENYNDQEEKAAEEKAPQFEELKEKNEKEYTYELDCAKLDKLKEILDDKVLQEYFLNLKEYRVLKFPGILQNILYLLNHKRTEINIPKTHVLNWKYVRSLVKPELIQSIIQYNHRGQKPNQVEKYAMVNRILAKVEKIDQDQVDQYNLYYGRLLKWLKNTCRLRKLDIEIRRANIEKKRATRESKIEESKKIQELKETQKQAKIQEIPPEEQETYDWTEWEKVFNEEHPIPEIPEEVQNEVDADCEFQE
eukprot:TRINITY_DN1121_c0_g2_i1.p2 TRINITY_DN1121_c0_g2~~TRINITY_DN1121_c0_g2_i1.p2  ORF type:complete len:658 (-),score=176.34 TRINITY_DN1121_c0_g2_i1:285-2258(-)